MKNKAIFLDRDGTINVEKHYLYKIDDFEFLPGVIEALRMLQEAGYLLIVVTNQSGIARGYYSEEDFEVLNSWMIEYLKEQGIVITKVYYCPHLPEAKVMKYRKRCSCRKPLLGMYERAIEEYDIDISKSWVIGDKIRDCSICTKYACRGFLISDNEKSDIVNQVKSHEIKNVSYAGNLLESAKRIVSRVEE